MAKTQASSKDTGASINGVDASKRTVMAQPHSSPTIRLSDDEELATHQKSPTVFRFFDLPAEMRNLVYRELLISKRQSDSSRFPRMEAKCHPAILASCHQAYNEANSIIYEENTLYVDLGYTGRCGRELAVNGEALALISLNLLRDRTTQWPRSLLKAKDLHLTISIPHRAYVWDHSIRVINDALYHFAHFLVESAALTTVHISFAFEEALSATHLNRLLAPLALMHAKKDITCCESFATKKHDIERILGSSSRPKPTTSILLKFQRLLERAEPALERERQMNLNGHHQLASTALTDQVRRGEGLLRGREKLCAETDDKLEVIVSDLERTLDECGP